MPTRSNPAFVYEALKVYLMLGGQPPVGQDLIATGWPATGPTISIPARPTPRAARLLDEHLDAMFDLEAEATRRWSSSTAR